MKLIDDKTRIDEILIKAKNGVQIDKFEACLLMNSSGMELFKLLEVAHSLSTSFHGNMITYSPKVFIPLTNLCRDRCGYCTFVKGPRQEDAHTMLPEEVMKVATEGYKLGCLEALFSLGDHPEWRHKSMVSKLKYLGYKSTPDYVAGMSQLVLKETGLLPHTNCGILDDFELDALRESNVSLGLMIESTSEDLFKRGGAHYGAESKHPSLRLDMLARAGKKQIPMTTGILVGIGETVSDRVDSFFAIKSVHEEYGNIQEVIIQNFRPKLQTRMSNNSYPHLIGMLKTLAVGRIVLGKEMNIQAPPNLNDEGHQSYLMAGINDWGGVSPLTKDFINPEAPWPDLKRLESESNEFGFYLVERLCLYPEYVINSQQWLTYKLSEVVNSYVDSTGFPQIRRN
ncbi:MAG: 7,8-didemethyl-8-hydroxy-5-deazariboflavin synthase subunit CofG [Chloroflexi bacterium]|nr:7,8-didemethyl-8-hydroxy-5-deazariboflavin synthase subunit CofG [Chloroflexota bacterium]